MILKEAIKGPHSVLLSSTRGVPRDLSNPEKVGLGSCERQEVLGWWVSRIDDCGSTHAKGATGKTGVFRRPSYQLGVGHDRPSKSVAEVGVIETRVLRLTNPCCLPLTFRYRKVACLEVKPAWVTLRANSALEVVVSVKPVNIGLQVNCCQISSLSLMPEIDVLGIRRSYWQHRRSSVAKLVIYLRED
uniref:(California timema) hypothetical protein n=1 Tax=Timema californicum TaxID=61474 RepID=A0A7R9JE10_TIMCA|nr:unnamed protein product [Timema californicum]